MKASMGFVPRHWPNAHVNIAAWYVFCLSTSSISAADCLADCVRRSRVPVGSGWEETGLPSRCAPEPGQDSGELPGDAYLPMVRSPSLQASCQSCCCRTFSSGAEKEQVVPYSP